MVNHLLYSPVKLSFLEVVCFFSPMHTKSTGFCLFAESEISRFKSENSIKIVSCNCGNNKYVWEGETKLN